MAPLFSHIYKESDGWHYIHPHPMTTVQDIYHFLKESEDAWQIDFDVNLNVFLKRPDNVVPMFLRRQA